jgi:glycine cleavage system transcriptional repressor
MHVAVTAVGADRPGIVAAVTDVLYQQGGNLEDCRCALLGGHFAMVMIVALPDGSDADALGSALAAAGAPLNVSTAVRPIAEAERHETPGTPVIVSVYGADKPGIVAKVSRAIANRHASITDLATRVISGERPIYVMILEVTLPAGLESETLDADLRALELGVDISIHPAESDTL